MTPIGKRIALSLMTAGAVTALVGGASFALFSSTAQSQNNTFAAGTVTLTEGTSTSCKITNMAPGDASTGWSPGGSDAPCTYALTYSGSLNAWVYVDASVLSSSAQAGTVATTVGTEPLYDGTPNGLQVNITDTAGKAISLGAGTVKQGTGGADNTFSSSAIDQVLGKFTNGMTDTITTNYSLPIGADNTYQGGTATITLTANAIQSKNNSNTGGTAPSSF